MKHNKTDTFLYGVFGLLLVCGAVLVYKFYTLKRPGQGEIAPIAQPAQRPTRPKTTTKQPKKTLTEIPSMQNVKKAVLKPRSFEPPQITHERKLKIQTKIAQRRFQKTTSLKVDWPEGLDYIEVDIEDGMKTIYGFNHNTGQELTAFARPAVTTVDEIKQYLKANSESIPNLKGQTVSGLSAPQPIKGAERMSGVGEVQVMSGSLGKDKSVHFALVNRKDQEGSYVFVFSGPKGSIDGNDGYVDQIYKSMRVLPKKK